MLISKISRNELIANLSKLKPLHIKLESFSLSLIFAIELSKYDITEFLIKKDQHITYNSTKDTRGV